MKEVESGGTEGESDLRCGGVSGSPFRRASRALMARGAGRGLPQAPPGRRGAVWAGIFFDRQAVFSLGAPGPLRRRAQSDCRGAAPRGLPGGPGVCVGARRENGAKMRCWAPWLCRLFLAFEMGAALVEIPLGFSTCRKIWLFPAPHEPSEAGPSPAVAFPRCSRLPISHTKSLAAAEVPLRPQRLPRALIHATARVLNAPRH